ncbi:hypothetical protein C8J57DRAFT_1233957 [Mycena rebaudengoi]|nr:hypothetical protein C8J57DRAFT_1233957 [Mycena rebaudengoi]
MRRGRRPESPRKVDDKRERDGRGGPGRGRKRRWSNECHPRTHRPPAARDVTHRPSDLRAAPAANARCDGRRQRGCERNERGNTQLEERRQQQRTTHTSRREHPTMMLWKREKEEVSGGCVAGLGIPIGVHGLSTRTATGTGKSKGSMTQDAGRTATGRPFGGTSGCNLVGPDHKPKAQVYGRRVPPPRQNSPVSTSQQKAVACLPFAECMRDHRSACSTSEEGSQLTIKPVSWPEKGVNGAGKTTRATECGVPRTRRSALRELAMTEIETTCEIFVLSGPDGPTSANMVCAVVQSIVGNGVSDRKARPPHINSAALMAVDMPTLLVQVPGSWSPEARANNDLRGDLRGKN